MSRRASDDRIAKIIRNALAGGHIVDIEGLGTFRPTVKGFDFVPEVRPRVFIAYVQEDMAAARRLFRDLKNADYQPWLDKENLLPGQNWPRAIDQEIEISDFFIPCFSKRSVLKRGAFQSELRFALDCASRLPLDDIFVIPARLDSCILPERITRSLQHVDLFPDWDNGVARIRRTIDHELSRKRIGEMPLAS
jgi:hypothetical protein